MTRGYAVSLTAAAPPDEAFRAWIDVDRWTRADVLRSAEIDGPFRPGAKLTSKAAGLPRSTVTITRVEPPGIWVDEARLPGVRMVFDHVVEPDREGSRLTGHVAMTGQLAFVVAPLLRRRLTALFEGRMERVARDAEAAALSRSAAGRASARRRS